MSDNNNEGKKRKDVNIDVPCAHYEIKPLQPHEPNQQLLTLHLVPVPNEALAEVQEVLKKYQASYDRLNEAIRKQGKNPEITPTVN